MFCLLLVIFYLPNLFGETSKCSNITFPGGEVKCVVGGHDANNWQKDSRLGEITAIIPPEDKDGPYYFVISMFVISTFCSTILTGAFLVLSIVLWSHFKQMKFFWFLSQLTICMFIMSSLNLLINVPATMFSLITAEFVQSEAFSLMSNIIDFCHNVILFSNLMIAIHRFFVFFLKDSTSDAMFDKPFIYIWLAFVWIFSSFITVSMILLGDCRYEYIPKTQKRYILVCIENKVAFKPPYLIQMVEIVMQFVVPILIFVIYIALIFKIWKMRNFDSNKYEMTILKQAFFVFIMFQISSSVFLLCQTIQFELATAFLIKRIINTTEIFAGAATPCFFFFTSKEIRKVFTKKVSTTSSQAADSNNPQRTRQTLKQLARQLRPQAYRA